MSVVLSAPGLLEQSQLLGDYKILEPAGTGGMGVVYRARQQSLNRDVALKVIREEIASLPEYRERFLREARLAASVDHPHVVSVHDVGEADGHLFLAMHWVDGSDLKQILETAGRLAPDRAVAIACQVGGALDAVHTGGLVHRDVKPANVLLREIGNGGDYAYLTDFGVAKPSDPGDQLTRTGCLVGTSGYLSPEQIRGQEPGPRSDLYALGCLFFETLTGRPPFSADNEMALRWAHANDPRPLVSAVSPELGTRYDRFVAVALAVDPAYRFASGREFAETLAAAHAGRDFAAAAAAASVIGDPYAQTAVEQPAPFPQALQTPPPGPALQTPLPAGPPFQTPPPGPVYPAYAYPTPPPPYPQPSRWGSPLALILLALLALAGIGAAVLAVAGVFTHQAPAQAAAATSTRAASVPRQPSSHIARDHRGRIRTRGFQTQTSTSSAPPSPQTGPGQNLADPGAPISSSPAGASLQAYWTLINTGHYRKAWAMETANEQSQEPSFLSDKKTAQPMINVVSIGPASSSSGSADVPIAFYAQDRNPSPGSDTACRYFQMTADMVQNGNGGWSYNGPIAGTAQATAEPGSTNCHS
jgi:serine/threonine protein kinase